MRCADCLLWDSQYGNCSLSDTGTLSMSECDKDTQRVDYLIKRAAELDSMLKRLTAVDPENTAIDIIIDLNEQAVTVRDELASMAPSLAELVDQYRRMGKRLTQMVLDVYGDDLDTVHYHEFCTAVEARRLFS